MGLSTPEGASHAPSSDQPRLPAVLVVDALGVGELYADTLRTHGITDRVEIALPTGRLADAAQAADIAICTPGDSRETLYAGVTALRSTGTHIPILFLAPPEANRAELGALEAGATDVLCKSPGYIDQLPTAVRKNLLLARRADSHAGQIRQLALALSDIRKDNAVLETLVQQFQAVAMTDQLTGLGNRRAIEQRLDEFSAICTRHHQCISLFMIDLDGLKLVNDLLGHQAGDDLIRLAGKLLRSHFRKGDITGRLGGDEFVVLLPNTCPERAAEVAGRLQAEFVRMLEPLQERVENARRALGVVSKISRDGRLNGGKLGMTIGVAASTPERRVPPKSLLMEADKAMYEGKRDARGTVRIVHGLVPVAAQKKVG